MVEKLIDPPGEARSDLEILVDLAERLGHGGLINNKTAKDTWDEWRKVSAHSKYNFEGITYERLQKERGLQWPCPTEDHPGTVRRYCKGDPFVQEGREIQFYGKPDNKAVVFLRPYIPSTEKTTDQYPLYLTTGRVNVFFIESSPAFIHDFHDPNWVTFPSLQREGNHVMGGVSGSLIKHIKVAVILCGIPRDDGFSSLEH